MTNVLEVPKKYVKIMLTTFWQCYTVCCSRCYSSVDAYGQLMELLLGRWCDVFLGLLPKCWWQPGGENGTVQCDVKWIVSLLWISFSSWTAGNKHMFWESVHKLMWGVEVRFSCFLWVIFRQGLLKENTINIQAKRKSALSFTYWKFFRWRWLIQRRNSKNYFSLVLN